MATTTETLILDSIAFITATMVGKGILDDESFDAALGDIDYERLAFGLSGICHYFAGAIATLEGSKNHTLRSGQDVLKDLASSVADMVN